MGLDITIKQKRAVICPHCSEVVETRVVADTYSGGRAWYPFLERVGYYVPYDKVTPENDWYGKDMELTREQSDYLYRYARSEECYNYHEVISLIAMAQAEGDTVAINADW